MFSLNGVRQKTFLCNLIPEFFTFGFYFSPSLLSKMLIIFFNQYFRRTAAWDAKTFYSNWRGFTKCSFGDIWVLQNFNVNRNKASDTGRDCLNFKRVHSKFKKLTRIKKEENLATSINSEKQKCKVWIFVLWHFAKQNLCSAPSAGLDHNLCPPLHLPNPLWALLVVLGYTAACPQVYYLHNSAH